MVLWNRQQLMDHLSHALQRSHKCRVSHIASHVNNIASQTEFLNDFVEECRELLYWKSRIFFNSPDRARYTTPINL